METYSPITPFSRITLPTQTRQYIASETGPIPLAMAPITTSGYEQSTSPESLYGYSRENLNVMTNGGLVAQRTVIPPHSLLLRPTPTIGMTNTTPKQALPSIRPPVTAQGLSSALKETVLKQSVALFSFLASTKSALAAGLTKQDIATFLDTLDLKDLSVLFSTPVPPAVNPATLPTTPVMTTPLADPTTSSLFHYLGIDFLQVIDSQQLDFCYQVAIKLALFTVLNGINWAASGVAQRFVQSVINKADSERLKLNLTFVNKTARVAIIVLGAFFTYMVVGGSLPALIGGGIVASLAFGLMFKDFIGAFINYTVLSVNSKYPVGSYIECNGQKGYVLYRTLRDTVLINFEHPKEEAENEKSKDKTSCQGLSVIKPDDLQETSLTAVPYLDIDDDEAPTRDIPDYFSIKSLAEGRDTVIMSISNTMLVQQPVKTYPRRRVKPAELEPYLTLLESNTDDDEPTLTNGKPFTTHVQRTANPQTPKMTAFMDDPRAMTINRI